MPPRARVAASPLFRPASDSRGRSAGVSSGCRLLEIAVPEELSAVLLPETPLEATSHFRIPPTSTPPGSARGGTDGGLRVLTTGTTVSKLMASKLLSESADV